MLCLLGLLVDWSARYSPSPLHVGLPVYSIYTSPAIPDAPCGHGSSWSSSGDLLSICCQRLKKEVS